MWEIGNWYTDKKEKKLFLICKEIQMGSVAKSLYHRERILETSTLSCNEEKEEITKPPKR